MKKFLLACVFFTAALCACKKKEPTVIIPGIYGVWKGKFSKDMNKAPDNDIIFRIEKNGKVFVYNGTDSCKAKEKGSSIGSFIVVGNITGIIIEYTYTNEPTKMYTITGILDASQTSLDGTLEAQLNNKIEFTGKLIANKQ
jgi:hypothetical protein